MLAAAPSSMLFSSRIHVYGRTFFDDYPFPQNEGYSGKVSIMEIKIYDRKAMNQFGKLPQKSEIHDAIKSIIEQIVQG